MSGSWDRTVRLWKRDTGKSRDVYHTKRMQRVFDVTYTPTADFVLSASDDGNVRIWKTNASQKLGPVSTKERAAMEYRQKLVEQWSSEKHVRQIAERRHLPASVHNTQKLKRDMLEARKVKEDRRRKHSRAGKEKPKAERKSESGRNGYEPAGPMLTCRRGHYQGTEVSARRVPQELHTSTTATASTSTGIRATSNYPPTHVLYIACHPHIVTTHPFRPCRPSDRAATPQWPRGTRRQR